MPPQIIVTAGVFRSGSTWLFNAARLLAMAGNRRVLSGFHNDVTAEAAQAEADFVVIKTHLPSTQMNEAIASGQGRMLISVRDPRDCVTSFMTTFDLEFARANRAVTQTCAHVLRAARVLQAPFLRYEDRFVDRRETIDHIVGVLGLAADGTYRDTVFRSLQPAAIERKISTLVEKGTIDQNKPEDFDPVTHWHPGHLGDGRTGKYRDRLEPGQIAEIERANHEFMRAFGYV